MVPTTTTFTFNSAARLAMGSTLVLSMACQRKPTSEPTQTPAPTQMAKATQAPAATSEPASKPVAIAPEPAYCDHIGALKDENVTRLDCGTIKIPDLDGDGRQETLVVQKFERICQKGDSSNYCYEREGVPVKPGTVVKYWEEGQDNGGFPGGAQLKLSSGKDLSDLQLNASLWGILIFGNWNDGQTLAIFNQQFEQEKNSSYYVPSERFPESVHEVKFGIEENLVLHHKGKSRDYTMVYGLDVAHIADDIPTFQKGDRVKLDYNFDFKPVSTRYEGVITGFTFGLSLLDTDPPTPTEIPAVGWFGIYVHMKLDDGREVGKRFLDIKGKAD